MTKPTYTLYNRRTFIKVVGYGMVGFFLILWQQLIFKHISLTGPKGFQKINISGKVDGVYFYDNFLVVKKGASITVLDNKCTHAGCKVNKEHNGDILCACHGSAYNSAGEVKKGPAIKSLARLKYTTDPVSGELTVRI